MKKMYTFTALLILTLSGSAFSQVADSLKLRRGVVELRSSVNSTSSRPELRFYVPDSAASARYFYLQAPLYLTTTWGLKLPVTPPTAGQYLKAVTADSLGWDTPAGGGGSLEVKEGDSSVISSATALDLGAGFDVTESPTGEANVTLDLTEKQVNLSTEVTGTLPDANVDNTITLDNLTQITTRNHSDLSGLGTHTSTFIDSSRASGIADSSRSIAWTSIKNRPSGLDDGDDNTNTQLSQEQVEDFTGGMFTSNTESLITTSYNDGTGKIDLTVNPNLGSYTNNAGFLTGNQSITLSGDITGSGATAITTALAANSVDGTHLQFGSDATGDIIYFNGTNYVRLGIGANNKVLKVAAGIPSWQDDDAGGGGGGSTKARNNGTLISSSPDVFEFSSNFTVSDGAVADSVQIELASSVSLLGQTIESSEITDGTLVNADVNASAAIAVSKMGFDPIEETELDTEAELEAQIGGDNVIVDTEIDTKAELEAILTDVLSFITGASNITALNDVTVSSTSAGQLLLRNSGNTAFENVNLSGDVSVTSAGVTTVADDSHDHIITNIDFFTEAALETQVSGVSDVFTNLDGALDDDNLGDNNLVDLSDVSGTFATGDILYRNGSSQWVRLAIGSNGEVLKIASGIPSWDSDATGGSLTIEEADASPSVSGASTIQFNQAQGFAVVDETGGQVQINLASIPVSAMGFDPIEETEMDTEAELEAQIGGANVVVETEMDTKAELEALLSDVTSLLTSSSTANDLADVTVTSAVAAQILVRNSGNTAFVNTAVSGDGSISSSGVLTVNDDSHNHVIGNVDAFTESALESQMTGVTDVFTNNDGALSDDDLTNNTLSELSDVTTSSIVAAQILLRNSGNTAWVNGSVSGDGTLSASGVLAITDDSHNHTTTTVSGLVLANDLNTFTSADLAGRLTNETGTGDAVFSTSPTISGATLQGVINGGGATSMEAPNGAGGTTVDVAGEYTVDTTAETFNFHSGTAERVLSYKQSKGATIESPSASEDIGLFFTEDAITISSIRAVLVGSSTPSVTWTIRHSTDRSATGNEVVTSGTTTTSTTTGSNVVSFNDATIPASSFVWFETTAQSGTVDQIELTLFYGIDP